MVPCVVELPNSVEKLRCFDALSQLPHCLFLESASTADSQGRYSFIAADPFAFLQVPTGSTADVRRQLRDMLAPYATETLPGLPPFQGGAAGLIGYDLNRSLESLPAPQIDPFQIPALAIGLYDVVVAFDHASSRQWIISQGFSDAGAERQRVAAERARWIQDLITDSSDEYPSSLGFPDQSDDSLLDDSTLSLVGRADVPDGVYSNFSEEAYLAAVGRVVDYIGAGDVFQVNIAQQLFARADTDSRTLYHRLRRCNPAPFAGYFDIDGQRQIISASPERFLRVRGDRVEARPIKGTRRRLVMPEANFYAGQELQDSVKDRAENIMILDLLRNDLSRVCIPESVRVTQLCDVEMYQFVLHLVSAVEGVLRSDCTALDLLLGAFPGGSITGAPKVRAMEIIQEIEPHARGAYCGSLGYLGFDGAMDLSILIRTISVCGPWWQIPVGGGIVHQSTPAAEYEETWHKARGMLMAVGQVERW